MLTPTASGGRKGLVGPNQEIYSFGEGARMMLSRLRFPHRIIYEVFNGLFAIKLIYVVGRDPIVGMSKKRVKNVGENEKHF